MPLRGCRTGPSAGCRQIFAHALTLVVLQGESQLGLRQALLGGATVPLRGSAEITLQFEKGESV